MLLLPVVVPASGAVVVVAGGVVAAGGGVVAGGACATCCAATALWLGGTVWSSRSAAYEAPTAPATSRAVSPNSVIAERAPGRVPMRVAAVPQARHQSCPGSIVAPHDLQVLAAGSTAGSSGGRSTGGAGGAPGAISGCASSSFTGLQGCTTRRHRSESRSRARDLQTQRRSVQPRAVHRLDDPLRLAARHGEEREALEHPHVADRLAVDPGRRGHGVDQVGHLDPLGQPDAGDELGARLV